MLTTRAREPQRRAEAMNTPKQATVPFALLNLGQPHSWPGQPASPDSGSETVRMPTNTFRATGDPL